MQMPLTSKESRRNFRKLMNATVTPQDFLIWREVFESSWKWQKSAYYSTNQWLITVLNKLRQPITTGTSVLGVKFDGGVALAGDMLGSYGSLARYPGVSRSIKVDDKTVVFASGDIADYQYLKDELERMSIENDIQDDGHSYSTQSIFSYLRLLMYYRRNKFNPIWNTLAVGGLSNGKPFLGYVDKIGSAYEEDSIATGYGAYIARPLITKALEQNGGTLTKIEAVKLLLECLKILYYRDARSINKFEIAVVTEEGVSIESNMTAETNWEIAHYVKGYE